MGEEVENQSAAELEKISLKLFGSVREAMSEYDARLVFYAVIGIAGELGSILVSADITKPLNMVQYFNAGLESALTPTKKKPIVSYCDGDQVLGTKQ